MLDRRLVSQSNAGHPGCGGDNGIGGGCPSQAQDNNGIGTIPSESFTVLGSASGSGSVPEPSSILLLGSGALGLLGVLRRKRFGRQFVSS